MPTESVPGDGSVKAIYAVLQAISAERFRFGKIRAEAVLAGDQRQLDRCNKVEKGMTAAVPTLLSQLMAALQREHPSR
ncbi:hypothetical protein BKE38_22365 [Pseudoroseomonas deserti]|uniref:Uncharacterized protein n=1 Tax=Teichococcus deserti TaxID=1817963 RepID=A0A1V2GWM3_9PROT|nr:hypothetical protein BKE38_22365 [Pseudoroseomonas deserti]